MFKKLSSRLFLTYMLLTGIILCILAAGIFLYLVRTPAVVRQLSSRLELIATLIVTNDRFPADLNSDRTPQIASRLDENFNVRIVLLDSDRMVLVDSRTGEVAEIPSRLTRSLDNTPGSPIQFIDSNRQVWIYTHRAIRNGNFLVVAAPRPKLSLAALTNERITTPFIQAGLVALGISLIFSIAISRWVAAPLEKIADRFRTRSEIRGVIDPYSGPSEVQDLAAAYLEMEQRVADSQQAQRNFVANVSHDLKTPLTSIQGFAQALLDGTANTPDQIRSAAEIIVRESDRMMRMVADLLDLAKLDAGIDEMNFSPVDLEALLTETLERFGAKIDEKHLQVNTAFDSIPTVIGDPDKLARVIGNLLDNGIKFTPSGGRISISTKVEPPSVFISIQDSGPGINIEDRDRIFDRFYRADQSRSQKNRGTGLGLPIAREIVRAHGGDIYVGPSPPKTTKNEQQPGPGSTFLIQIPIVRPEDSTLVKRRGIRQPKS